MKVNKMQSKVDVSSSPEVIDQSSAKAFFIWCVENVGDGFHPENSFSDYIEREDDTPSFSSRDAKFLDGKLDKAFDVLGDEAYGICLDILKSKVTREVN